MLSRNTYSFSREGAKHAEQYFRRTKNKEEVDVLELRMEK